MNSFILFMSTRSVNLNFCIYNTSVLTLNKHLHPDLKVRVFNDYDKSIYNNNAGIIKSILINHVMTRNTSEKLKLFVDYEAE